MVNVVTYCRVSSDEQAQKDISIPAQRKALNRWVADRADHHVLRDFEDQGESAYAPAEKRPGFCEMIAFCRKNDVQAILVHKLDRFSRNREESIIFKGLLRKAGVQVRSITETFDADTPQGFLYEGMIEVINQFYSMNLATETLKGMRENAERGYHNGGKIPYGYRLERFMEGTRERGRLVPGPDEEVAIVREIFDLAGNHGYGGKRIVNVLNKRGVRAPRARHWNTSTVGKILNNQVYVGDQVWFRSKKSGRSGRERTSEEHWIVTKDAHEALVERDLFEKRKRMAKTRRFDDRKSRTKSGNYLLSRLIRCDHCGSRFLGRRQKKRTKGKGDIVYFRYYCGGYLAKGPSVCPSLPINTEWADNIVLDLLRARLCGEGTLDKLEARIRERIEARRKTYGTSPKVAAQKLSAIDGKIANYYRAIGEGMDISICQQHIAKLVGQKQALEQEAEVLQQEDYYDRALEQNITELRRFATAFDGDFDELPLGVRREILLKFVDEIVVEDRERLRIRLRVPFDNQGIKVLTDGVVSGGGEGSDQTGEGPDGAGFSQKYTVEQQGGAILY